MSFKTIAGGFNGAFWWYGPLSEDQEIFKQIYQNYLVALKLFMLEVWFFFFFFFWGGGGGAGGGGGGGGQTVLY